MLLLFVTCCCCCCCSSDFVVIMSYSTGTEGFYRKMLELQEKLRRSEEERLKLEEKFNEMMRFTRDTEHERLRVLRHKYHRFLEEDRVRQERNENILRALDRIESQAKTFAAKTDRFKALRKQYNAYIRRIYAPENQQPTVHARTQQDSDIHTFQPSYPHARKQLFSDLPATQRPETKIAMLEQYLLDNFNSVPYEKNGDSTLFNGNRQFTSRQNGFPAAGGYSLPEVPSENRNYLRQSETLQDSPEPSSIENEFPATVQNEMELKFPEKHALQSKKTEKSELLGNTIEQELDRFREKESTKQNVSQKTGIDILKTSTHDPYVQNYKDLVSESAKKFGLHNGSHSNRPKRTTDMTVDIHGEEKISVLDNKIIKSDDSVSDKIVSDTLPEQREENKVKFEKCQENQDSDNENPTIKECKELASTLKEENIAETNNEELSCEQELVEQVSPEQWNDGVEKLEVLEQDDNVDLRSKTPEVSSARTEPPDDITLTTPSPIHLPVSEKTIAKHKHESLVPENKQSPVHLDQTTVEAPVQQSSISKDLQDDTLIPQITDTEQMESLGEKSVVDEVTENQNYPVQHESKVSEELDPNYPTEASILEKQPEYQGVDETGQPMYENQVYQNVEAQQVYHEEEFQPQDGYDPQSYPVPGQPEVYDAQQYPTDQQVYPIDQQKYPADQEHYPVDQQQYPIDQQQYSTEQEHYGAADQQQSNYPTGQEQYLVTQEEYPADQQQYTADQYPIDQQQYSGEQHEQYSVTQAAFPQDQQYSTDQQEYPTGQEQYPTDQQQYVTDEQYTADQQQYQQEYPSEQYPGQVQSAEYDPAQYAQHYEPEQPYVEGEYDPQSYPEGYNQDAYRSEQEYLQGEQNIDLQYQTEVTGEEYQGEFTNNEYQEQQQQQGDTVEQHHQPHQSITPQQSSSEPVKSPVEQENSLPAAEQDISASTEKSVIQNVVHSEEKPAVEKKLPNLADMLDTDTESTKQETKVSNDSDFDFSNT